MKRSALKRRFTCEMCGKPVVRDGSRWAHADGQTYRHRITVTNGLKRSKLRARSTKGQQVAKTDGWWHEQIVLRDLTCRVVIDGQRCGRVAECGHHVVQKSVRPDLRHNLDVGIGVCGDKGPCHTWIHSQWERPTSDDPDEVLADPSELWIVTAGMADRWLTAGGQQQIGVGR